MYEDPNVSEQSFVAVITFASDEANEKRMEDEIKTRIVAVVDELGHDVAFLELAVRPVDKLT